MTQAFKLLDRILHEHCNIDTLTNNIQMSRFQTDAGQLMKNISIVLAKLGRTDLQFDAVKAHSFTEVADINIALEEPQLSEERQ